MVQAAPMPAHMRALHEVTAPAQPPGCPKALPKVSLRPKEPPKQRRAKCRGVTGTKCLLWPLSNCTSCGSPGLSITAHHRVRAPTQAPERDPPERDFGTREKRGGLRGVVKPRTSHPYPESTDPDPLPSLRALPAAARPGKGVWALDSHRHSAAASPGSSPEALTAQGAKQEAGINGWTDGRARMSRSWG